MNEENNRFDLRLRPFWPRALPALIVDSEIQLRLNIAGYEPGDSRKCWDETIRRPKFWAVCTGPVSRPPERMLRRGFQGIRYTEDLW